VVIALEQRFLGTPDGAVWTEGVYPRSFWDRYLVAFDEVTILARVRRVDRPEPRWRRVDDAVVRVHAVTDYRGPLQYLLRRSRIRSEVRAAVREDAVFILRVPGQIGTLAAKMLAERGQLLNLEVVGDPRDGFAGGASRHPLRAFFRVWYARNLRLQCARAQNVAYVTQDFLQRSYPPRAARDGRVPAASFAVSDVELGDAAFVASRVPPDHAAPSAAGRAVAPDTTRPLRIASIGAMNQPYKGFSDLIVAAVICRSGGRDLELTLVGDGPLRPQLERQARSLGIEEHVRFVGQLPAGQAVQDELDRADIYVQPSLVEGLPRALVEAMARGCPCIATRVGGIPELLPAEFLVAPRRPAELAAAIEGLARDPGRLREASRRNIEVARTFAEAALAPRRLAFHRAVITAHRARLEGAAAAREDAQPTA
jgi:glycosyltransferase involved in cell wall biosynthesis